MVVCGVAPLVVVAEHSDKGVALPQGRVYKLPYKQGVVGSSSVEGNRRNRVCRFAGVVVKPVNKGYNHYNKALQVAYC
jgi:hypothetical protein